MICLFCTNSYVQQKWSTPERLRSVCVSRNSPTSLGPNSEPVERERPSQSNLLASETSGVCRTSLANSDGAINSVRLRSIESSNCGNYRCRIGAEIRRHRAESSRCDIGQVLETPLWNPEGLRLRVHQQSSPSQLQCFGGKFSSRGLNESQRRGLPMLTLTKRFSFGPSKFSKTNVKTQE